MAWLSFRSRRRNNQGRAAAGQQDGRNYALNFEVVCAVAVALVDSRVIVIVEEQQWNVRFEMRLRVDEPLPERRHIELVDHGHLRVHRQMKLRLVQRSIHFLQLADVGKIGFADEDARAWKLARIKLVCFRTHLLHHFVQARLVVSLRAVELRIAVCVDHRLAVLVEHHALIGQALVLKERRNRVEAKPSHAALEPEGDDLLEGVVHGGVVPVQVRLLGVELVVVILPRLFIPLPGRVAEERLPVVRRLPLAKSVWPGACPELAEGSCQQYQSR